MITQIFAVPLNPQPWKVPPASGIRKGNKVFVKFGQDEGGVAFKLGVKESLESQGAFMMEPGYSLDIYTWRKREQYKDKANRTRTKNKVDGTNMQKLIEDALTGTCFHDDVDNIAIRTIQVEQSIATVPRMVLVVRGELEIIDGGIGTNNFFAAIPPDVRTETEEKYRNMMLRIQNPVTKINNEW
ncbi:RusA-like Holliday junction resolvase [Gordonia phage Gmala1]|uniref:RusA-like ribonuclease n=1 Tax=Gordonia phage Gmala1 TaxID=1622190 RepID=A0A0E3T5X3_9CAUD|nr:RusA-like Holliday junction resolvase [Gordonia phage Gmala1]AKC02886.1 RusA-like ribonuclease [Gordonia phage Gmala1]